MFGPVKGGPDFEGYFRGQRPEEVRAQIIPVCVPLYNEEAYELVLTLRSLYRMQKMIFVTPGFEDYRLSICVIQDGFAVASETFKAAMRIMFPPSRYDDYERRLDAHVAQKEVATCVLQAPQEANLKLLNCVEVLGDLFEDEDEEEVPLEYLDITIVIKADNRKKTNSHDLFFQGFAYHHNPEFVFATDCGTLFDNKCLKILLQTIMRKDNCVAVTGRQRVMTRFMQPGCEEENWWAWVLRNVQGYDYEASVVLFNGCFSLLGGLPVIPGPCGLFRLPPLMEKTMDHGRLSPFEFYMNAASRAEEDKSMLAGNCLLAEDRVLTFAAEFLTEGKSTVHWAKNALFYFQAETELKSLVAQRRRWLNGTVAGYVYVHQELGKKGLPTGHGCCKIFLLRCLIKLMLFMYAGIAIGPALYAYAFCEGLKYLRAFDGSLPFWNTYSPTEIINGTVVNLINVTSSPSTEISSSFETMLIGIAVFYYFAFVAFSIAHHLDRYDARLFAACGIMNTVAMTVTISAMILSSLEELTIVQWFSFVYLIAPVLLNLFIPNFMSLTYLLNPFRVLAFYLFLPTMQGFFLTLSIARTFDLSWGNRAGIGGEQDDLKKEAQTLMILQWIANLVLLVFLFGFNEAEWFVYVQYALVAFLLLPMSILTAGSLRQELGKFWSMLLLLLATAVVLGWFGYFGWFGDVGSKIQNILRDYPVLNSPLIQAVVVILVVVLLKTLITHVGRFFCQYGQMAAFDEYEEEVRPSRSQRFKSAKTLEEASGDVRTRSVNNGKTNGASKSVEDEAAEPLLVSPTVGPLNILQPFSRPTTFPLHSMSPRTTGGVAHPVPSVRMGYPATTSVPSYSMPQYSNSLTAYAAEGTMPAGYAPSRTVAVKPMSVAAPSSVI